MKIVTLVENTTNNRNIKAKHGLSFYIETQRHNILFDVGPDDTFIKNAYKLNIDLTKVDIVVISHGHKDHGGGLKYFLQINNKAKIYIRKNAFERHYTKVLRFNINIGLNPNLISDRFVFTDSEYIFDNDIRLFSYPYNRKYWPKGNMRLFSKDGLDNFYHEQHLLINDNDKYYLFCGCAHTGIYNIITKAESIVDKNIDYTIGGFHLFDPVSKKIEDESLIKGLSKDLSKKQTKFYTCHCTGVKAYKLLKNYMNDKLEYLACGESLEFKA